MPENPVKYFGYLDEQGFEKAGEFEYKNLDEMNREANGDVLKFNRLFYEYLTQHKEPEFALYAFAIYIMYITEEQ